MSAEEPAVELLLSEPEYTVARSGNLVFIVWRGLPTAARARQISTHVRDLSFACSAKGIGLVIVLETGTQPPEAAARPVLARSMRENGPRIRGVAYVVPASGFMGATIRGAITGLSLLAREPYPTEVFASPDRASAWIAERLGNDWTAARALAAVERARQR